MHIRLLLLQMFELVVGVVRFGHLPNDELLSSAHGGFSTNLR